MPIDNLSKITSRSGINTTILLEAGNANVTGIVTAAGLRVNTNDSAIAGIITQSGSGHALYVDGRTVLGNTQSLPTFNASTQLVVSQLSGNSNFVDMTILGGRAGRSMIKFGDQDSNNRGSLQYHHVDESINFYNNGNTSDPKLTIDSGGNIGIGTTNPQDNAHFQHFQSTGRHQSFQSTNGDLAIVTDNNSNPAVYIKGTGTADLLNVFDNTTEVLKIEDGGNITFGIQNAVTAVTSSPIKYISGGRDYWNGTKGDYRALRLRVYDNGGNIDDQYGIGVSNGQLEIQSQGSIGFYASSAGGGTGRRIERFIITSAGNIGINSTSPNAQFVLNRSLTENNAIEMGYSSSDGGLHFIQAYNRSTSAFTLLKLNNALKITSAGKVGINTTPGASLEVNGGSSYDVAIFNTEHADGPLIPIQKAGSNIGFLGSGKNCAPATGGATDLALRSQANLIFTSGGGVETLRIDSNGDINLGNNPTNQYGYKLNIQDSAIIYAQTASSGGLEAKWHLDNSAQLMTFGTVSTDDLSFVTTNVERLTIKSDGVISFGSTVAAVTPSQNTRTSIGHTTMTGGHAWFDHSGTVNYIGVDGDWKLTNGATYGKIVARNTSADITNATEAGHTWFLIVKTVSGTVGNSNWVVETCAGWKMAWPHSLSAGAVAEFYMRDAVESYGSPTIPASGDYYIGWFFSPSQDRGTNGGSYYVDATSGGNVYWVTGQGDLSNPGQYVPRQGSGWTGSAVGQRIHFRYETLPKADLTGTVFSSPLLVDPVIQGTPLMDGFPMSGGQLVKDVQWSSNTASVEFMNADFVNCNYLIFYNISGGHGGTSDTGWYETRMQICDQAGSFFNNTNDYVSHAEWLHSGDTGSVSGSSISSPNYNDTGNERGGYARSIWLTGNGADYNHIGWVWVIPSNFRHNRSATIAQEWGSGTAQSSTLPHIVFRGHSYLTAGTQNTSYREEGGGIYRGTSDIFTPSGFRIFGAGSGNPHTPASSGSGNGYVRIYRFRSGLETREGTY